MPFPATLAFAIFPGGTAQGLASAYCCCDPAVGRSFGGADTGPLFVPGR